MNVVSVSVRSIFVVFFVSCATSLARMKGRSVSPLFVKIHGFVLTGGVHVHLSPCTESQPAWLLHTVWKEAMHPLHRRSTRGRNWPFLQDKVPPLLVQIQAPADNTFESMLASIHVSFPRHNSRQCGSPRNKLDRFHRTKLCIQRSSETTLGNLPTVDIKRPPHVCRPGTKFLVVNVTTFSHVGQDPVRKSNAKGRDQACGQNTFFQDLKTLLPRELMNAHLTATSPSSRLLSPCNLWKQFGRGRILCLAWLAPENCGLRIVGGDQTQPPWPAPPVPCRSHAQPSVFLNGPDHSHRPASVWQLWSDCCWNCYWNCCWFSVDPTLSANLTFFRAGSGTESHSPAWAF